jgi:hypothetical protein
MHIIINSFLCHIIWWFSGRQYTLIQQVSKDSLYEKQSNTWRSVKKKKLHLASLVDLHLWLHDCLSLSLSDGTLWILMTIRGKITATNWYPREENEAGNRSGSKQQKWGREAYRHHSRRPCPAWEEVGKTAVCWGSKREPCPWTHAEESGDPSFTNRPTRVESGPPPHRGCLPSNDGAHAGMEAAGGGEGRKRPARSARLRASGSCAPHAVEAIRLPYLSDSCVKAVQGGVERCGSGCWDREFETSS